jgi:imidazole glycerol-phosphate synthase subunit HisH
MKRKLHVTVFDYGAGNLHSLMKALASQEVVVRVETDAAVAIETDALVLPGVGAFSTAAQRLAPARDSIRDAVARGLPCLGICLGMQLFFQESEEGPGTGLGLVSGRVTRLRATRVPHIGWNTVAEQTDPTFAAVGLTDTYYAHSYVCRPDSLDNVTAWTSVEADRFPAAIRWRNTVGVQFHPEKSSAAGVRFLRAFVDGARR